MNNGNNGESCEAALLKLYMDVTGSNETEARGVFMHVCRENGQTDPEIIATSSLSLPQSGWNRASCLDFPDRVGWQPPPSEVSNLRVGTPVRSFA